MKRHEVLARALSWASRSTWAVLDQAFFAGANFFTSILLARWLATSEYGVFSFAYAFYLLIATFHTSLWVEPMLLYGSTVYLKQLPSYLGLLQRYHWLFGIFAFFLILIFALVFIQLDIREVANAFVGLAISVSFALYLWIARRICYISLSPQVAAIGSGAYMLIYVGGLALLSKIGLLSLGLIFVLMGIASYFSATIILWMLRLETTGDSIIIASEVASRHWRYGRWALLASVFSWIPANLSYLLLPLLLDIDASAIIRALNNLLSPAIHFVMALAGLFVPVYVRLKDVSRLRKAVLFSAVFMFILTSIYWSFISLFGEVLVRWMYFDRYADYVYLLKIIGVIPVLVGIGSAFSSLLRALDRPELIAWSYGAGAMIVVVGIYPFISYLGIQGAVYTWLLGQGIMTFGVLYFGLTLLWKHS
jgi:O-antigen/teichoic acid export membrane protein